MLFFLFLGQVMIDKLVFRCNFAKVWNPSRRCMDFPLFKLQDLDIPLEVSLSCLDGEYITDNIRHPWERIPSSYEGMAFKVFDHRFDALECFYIEIKASPAKLMQGHNVFGSVDFCDCALRMIALLSSAYPALAEKLDFSSWFLAQIDITYSSRAKSEKESKAFINALQNVSSGQTKSRTGYDGTAYFGQKNSRLKKIKVYAKHSEVLQTIEKKKKQKAKKDEFVFSEPLLDFSEGLIRWEVSLYHRYFERMGISCDLSDIIQNNTFSSENLRHYWGLGTADLFKALKGQEMKVIDDNAVLIALRSKFSRTSEKTGKVSTAFPDSVFRTYINLRRDGWQNVKNLMVRNNFQVHVRTLCECGLSRAALQNMNGLDDGSKMVSFAEFTKVDFDNQYPDWYEPEPPKYTREIFLNEKGNFDFLNYDFGLKPVEVSKNKILPLVRTSAAFYSFFSYGKKYVKHPIRHFAALSPRYQGYAIWDFWNS
jgi:II/X family phage/plasmid replication protein